MIDLLIVKSPLGPVKQYHQSRLARGVIGRFSAEKHKPITTYINSPLTGARMEVQYTVEEVDGNPTAYVEIVLPLASATIGQNYIHAGLDSIFWELRCAAQLIRLILFTLGFHTEEVDHFMANAETQLCELTWHTSTASVRARTSLQRRTIILFEHMEGLNSRHDINIADVDVRRRNSHSGLFVTLKSGDEFRQYGKFDHALLRSREGKQRYGLAAELKAHKKELLTVIETHVRNEVRLSASSLKTLGLEHPSTWTSNSLGRAVDYIWDRLGLGQAERCLGDEDKSLSEQAQRTLEEYTKGNLDFISSLPPYTVTRHRKAIKDFAGVDIAERGAKCKVNPVSLGRQIQYARRWRPEARLREWTLCEVTGPGILLDIERGNAYIRDGELPNIEDADDLEKWLSRWKKFVNEERLNDHSKGEGFIPSLISSGDVDEG